MQATFALRYQVYCINRAFLPAEDFPDGLERDEFDRFSDHFCAISSDGRIVGSVRLVRPPSARPFPFESRCTALYRDVARPPSAVSAEVSRLVIDRRHAGGVPPLSERDSAHYFEVEPLPPSIARRTHKPEIVLGLYRAMYQFSRRAGIKYWYAAMERSLARALKRYHVELGCIGPETDYFGPVAPYLASLDELENRVGEANPELLRWFQSA